MRKRVGLILSTNFHKENSVESLNLSFKRKSKKINRTKVLNHEQTNSEDSTFKRGITIFKHIQNHFFSSKIVKKKFSYESKLSRMDSYGRRLWMKNFFVILFYVKIFIFKMKRVLSKNVYLKLKKINFDIINDKAHFSKKYSILNYKEKLNNEWNKIIEDPLKNKILSKYRKGRFCKIIIY